MNILHDAPDRALTAALEASGLLIAAWDIPTGRFAWIARPAGLLDEAAPEHAGIEALLAHIHPQDAAAARQRIAALLEGGVEHQSELRIVGADGGIRWMVEQARLQRSPAGAALRLSIVLTDITGRKAAEEQLRQAEKARSGLVREMNHRMKNSMQMVASLVQLHRMRTRDEAARSVFDTAVARVRAVAEIHRLLYQGDHVGDVDLAALLRPVADGADIENLDGIALDLPEGPVAVPVDQAIPIGLLLNELLVNADRHAYAGGPGPVRIALSRGASGAIRLTVADEGRGLPAGLDWRTASSLGLMLLRTLTAQIDGELEISSGPLGTTATVAWQV